MMMSMRSSRRRILVSFVSLILVFVFDLVVISQHDGFETSPDFLRARYLKVVVEQEEDDAPSHDVSDEERAKEIQGPSPGPLFEQGGLEESDGTGGVERKESHFGKYSRPVKNQSLALPFGPFKAGSGAKYAAERHLSGRDNKFQDVLTRMGYSNPSHERRGLAHQQPHVPPVMVNLPAALNFTAVNKDNRIIYYLHIHKSAGTTICRAAEFNGMNVSETNCNVQLDQRCCGENDSLKAQQEFARSTKYEFIANEQDMYSAMDTDHYRYAVMLRDSKSRYKSHWKHVYRRSDNRSNVENFTGWWKKQPDNWNVRKICGTPCMNTSKYGITQDLWNQTLTRMGQFEDILLKERFNETFTKFASRVGWTRMPVHQPSTLNVEYPVMPAEWDPRMSVLDDALYEYAQALYEESPRPRESISMERQDALNRYFVAGGDNECVTPCCTGTCSTY